MRWDNVTVEDRFFDKVHFEPNTGCWIWCGAVSNGGYGSFFFEGKPRGAHRVSYIIANGSVPSGMHIDHLCRNPWCVNPEHLEPVTLAENTRRGLSAEATRRRHQKQEKCSRGHPRKGDNIKIYLSNSGRIYRVCVTCQRENDRTSKLRAKSKRELQCLG
jgi:hypothetical protein